jgi:hypothetical protein
MNGCSISWLSCGLSLTTLGTIIRCAARAELVTYVKTFNTGPSVILQPLSLSVVGCSCLLQRMERERQERLQTQAEIDSAYQRSLEEDRRKVRDSRISVFPHDRGACCPLHTHKHAILLLHFYEWLRVRDLRCLL